MSDIRKRNAGREKQIPRLTLESCGVVWYPTKYRERDASERLEINTYSQGFLRVYLLAGRQEQRNLRRTLAKMMQATFRVTTHRRLGDAVMSDDIPARRCMDSMLVNNRPETDDDARKTGKEGHMICGFVTRKPFGAFPTSLGQDDGMRVVNSAVEEVENVAAEDGSQRHDSPILRKAADSECVRDY